MKKGNSPAGPQLKLEKSRRARFLEIAPKRVTSILKKLHSLGKCSRRQDYDFNEDEVNKIFAAIDAASLEAKLRFTGKQHTEDIKFAL